MPFMTEHKTKCLVCATFINLKITLYLKGLATTEMNKVLQW